MTNASKTPHLKVTLLDWPPELRSTIESLSIPPELPQGNVPILPSAKKQNANTADRDPCPRSAGSESEYKDLFMLRAPSSDVAQTILDIVTNFKPTNFYGRLAFYNVTLAKYQKFDKLTENDHLHKTYTVSELGGLLSFKMPAGKHNAAVEPLVMELRRQAEKMLRGGHRDGLLLSEFMWLGDVTVKATDGASAKEADETLCPCLTFVPSLTIECGNSESMPALIRDKD